VDNRFKVLDLSTIEKYDLQKMYKIYDEWPEIAEKSFQFDYDLVDFKNISHIVFAGMGGSGAISDIFYSILSKTDIHVDIVKGYSLPKTVNLKSLVVITSVSGNTIESLTILEEAKKIGCEILVFSNGGKMEEFCKKNNIKHRKIPRYHSPRASFVSFLYSMLKILQNVLPIEKQEIEESIEKMKILRKQIYSKNLSEKNPALVLSKWISGIPLIYYPWGLQASAIRFKNSLQENAKIHTIVEDIIEACHNGIVAWDSKNNIKPILLRGEDDFIKTKERWEIVKEFFQNNDIEYKEIKSVKGNILSKIICLIYLLDYSSIYLAVLSGIDPSPVKSIDFIKSKL
jgi:glucose/mannose-6-phosphate isomerase